jgi:bifunctional ADP-heptose synthase (sugar kinase/adenylyltransferase)
MKILVIGDSCIDKFIYGDVLRISPEAPVPIIEPFEEITTKGMAGNVYQNLKNLGVDVHIITNKTKSIKTRYVEKETNQMLLRVDVNKKIESFNYDDVNLNDYEAIVISDYNKGFLSFDDIRKISENHPLTFLDTKKKKLNNLNNIKVLKINEKEYLESEDYLKDFPNDLVITLGKRGTRYKDKIYPVDPVTIFNLTGAGDVFLAALVYDYLNTNSMESAVKFGNKCASKSVQRRGTGLIDKKDKRSNN